MPTPAVAPTGKQHALLTPDDPRQVPGRRTRTYPLHLMQPGDWFQIPNASPLNVGSLRGSVHHWRHSGHTSHRFSVRLDKETGCLVCIRLA